MMQRNALLHVRHEKNLIAGRAEPSGRLPSSSPELRRFNKQRNIFLGCPDRASNESRSESHNCITIAAKYMDVS